MSFVGAVAFPDPEKAAVYEEILSGCTTEAELAVHLGTKAGLGEQDIRQLCRTLRALEILDGNGRVDHSGSIKEYGKYRLTFLDNRPAMQPFRYLTLSVQREKPDTAKTDGDALVDELARCLMEPQLLPEKATGRFIRADSPVLMEQREETRVVLEYNDAGQTPAWQLVAGNNRFRLPAEPSIGFFFRGAWDESRKRMAVKFESVEHDDKAVMDFKYSFHDSFSIDDWGELELEYIDVPIRPSLSDARRWYESIFFRSIDQSRRYLTRNELETIWHRTLDETMVFKDPLYKSVDFSFNYDHILGRYTPGEMQYWLLQAAEDLSIAPADLKAAGDFMIPIKWINHG